MKSMTGFGRVSNRATAAIRSPKKSHPKTQPKTQLKSQLTSSGKSVGDAEFELDISVKSVNGRYLETRLHLPREYAGLESEFKALVQKTFSRGTVDIYFNRLQARVGGEVQVNTELASRWLSAYRMLGRSLKLKDQEPSLELLARVPDVLRVDASAEPSESERRQALLLLQEAVLACNKEREREGKALEAELQNLCQGLEALVEKIQELRAEANEELERRYRERLKQYLQREGLQAIGLKESVDTQRVAQEIVIQLDRADITEELARLKEHLKAYRLLLKSSEPQGKKLDFYAQELLREVNTIGSKSQVAKLTALVVEAKTLVERIREQVQNVE